MYLIFPKAISRCLAELFISLIVLFIAGCSEHKEIVVRSPNHHPSPPPPSPVYNAIFSPTESGSTADLTDATSTTVSFYIGPHSAASALQAADQAVSAEVLRNKSNVPLLITMVCPFCQGNAISKESIVYFGSEGHSSKAEFQFTPLRGKVRDASGLAQIGFQVTRNGVQLDYVTVNVRVNLAGSSEPRAAINQPNLARRAQLALPLKPQEPDLTLSFQSGAGGTIEVTLEGTPQVEALFKRKNRDPGSNQLRVFRTGLAANEIEDLVRNFYLEFNATVNNNSELQAKLRGSVASVGPAVSGLVLSEADQKLLLQGLATHGALWYTDLFGAPADADLRAMMAAFPGFSLPDRPIRVRIESSNIYLPWQILVPPPGATAKSNDFWGFRYELSVEPMESPFPHGFGDRLYYVPQPGHFVYGQYRGTSADDIVASLATSELSQLQDSLGLTGVVANSADSFRQSLVNNRDHLQMILTFTHGQSGTIVSPAGAISQDPAGPQLLFATNESLPVAQLSPLLGSVGLNDTFFPQGPLVFLNGCETGTAGFYPTTNQAFAGTFLRMGARGVIVTEAPIWTFFGYNFGLSLVKEIKSGEPIAVALLKVRKDYLANGNNPLGLMYSYYGGADVAVDFTTGLIPLPSINVRE